MTDDWAPRIKFSKRFWVGCAITLLSVSFLVVTALQARDAWTLAASNITVPATVIGQSEIAHASDAHQTSYYIEYQFSVTDQRVSDERAVPEAFFRAHPVGTMWDITVNPDDTTLHDLYDGQTRATAGGFLAAAALVSAFGVGLALSGGNLSALRKRFKR